MNPDDLRDVIDAELRRLPAPRAPATLVPRVMAEVSDRRGAPWYTRAWVSWPIAWQAASVLVLAAAAALVWAEGASAADACRQVAAWLDVDLPASLSAVTAPVVAAAAIVRVLWQVWLLPLASAALVLALTVSLACAAVWTAVDRFALGEGSRP